MINHTDTICAIASAMTNAGIGIIRISGPEAIIKIDTIFKGKEKLVHASSHTVHYGHIVHNDKVLDEVMVLVLRAPKTYTTEDTIEIDCHGGVFIMQEILNLIVSLGIRVADPGEFTKRAFLNGRIDLSQAESVMDLIESQSNLALQNSLNQLHGHYSNQIKDMREAIIFEIAFIESALDDPEHYSLDGYYEKLLPKIKNLEGKVDDYISSSKNGSLLKEGIKTVIVGKPNAGKSSLLNLLAKKDRAIVTDIAGTTRDILEETISLNGFLLRLIDTAGIRQTDDIIEKIGVEKSLSSIEEADLILYVVDGSKELDVNDFDIINKIKNYQVIVLLNKSDLDGHVDKVDLKDALDCNMIAFSAKTGDGLDLLESAITDLFFHGQLVDSNEVFLTNARHISAMKNVKESLSHVVDSINNNMPEDFLSIDLMDAYEQLGYIIGESVEDDLVNEIFAKFCTGK